jgi:hypothetical protein
VRGPVEEEQVTREWVRGLVLQLGAWYLYEIDHWLHAGIVLRPAFRNRLKCHLFFPIFFLETRAEDV